MKVFICQIHPAKEDFLNSGTQEEFAVVGRHFEYLEAATLKRQVLHAGRCEDASFGIVLFSAADLEAAWDFVRADPAVAAGIFVPAVWEYRIALGAIPAP